MPGAKKKVVPNLIVIEMTEYEAEELAGFLDQTDMHMSIGDRKSLARTIRQALKD